MMQTHNILTELNEARCPGPLRCWSQDWRLGRAGLHLGDSQHSDNSGIWAEILRRRNNNISQLSVPDTDSEMRRESVSKDWVIWMTNSRKPSLPSPVTPLASFIITMHCNVLRKKSANQMPGQRHVDQWEARTGHNYQRDRSQGVTAG